MTTYGESIILNNSVAVIRFENKKENTSGGWFLLTTTILNK